MKIGSVELRSPYAIAPMAGMTDTAFRRLVKRHGGCGLVVTEMVSAEGLVRGIDRTLEYAEYTEEERPVSIQIFGGDPEKMAAAAQIVEGMGADIVDVNMGCPVPKIAKHNAGCSLMREPAHAASVIAAMAKAVKIPVTVKMRAGWNDGDRNAPTLAKMVQDAGAAAIAVHGRTAEQSYSGVADWDLVARIAADVDHPGLRQRRLHRARANHRSGCVPECEGVLVGRGVLRNPWILAQAADLAAGRPAHESRSRIADASCSTISSCYFTSGSMRRVRCRTIGGWSTNCARSARGTPKASRTARISARPSTAPTRCRRSAKRSRHSSAWKQPFLCPKPIQYRFHSVLYFS